MNLWSKISGLGRLPLRRVVWGLCLLFSLGIVLDIFHLGLGSGLAASTYDAMVRQRIYASKPDPRLVIIDIDEKSLLEMGETFGRWPWPRDTLATVLSYLEKQEPAAIVWDILFSEADKLNPGGDVALNEAIKKSRQSHFSVVRLPKHNDALSRVDSRVLPGFWVAHQSPVAHASKQVNTVAVIPPFLSSIARAKVGYNNGYVDRDGVLRRYRPVEQLKDTSQIKSIAHSVLETVNPNSAKLNSGRMAGDPMQADELIAWRKTIDAYPRVSFSKVFRATEDGQVLSELPSVKGKIVIIGSSAPSLGDIHPTPLSNISPGVLSLATVIDNTVNDRRVHELPRWFQAVLAIALCLFIASVVQWKSLSLLTPWLFPLPGILLVLSYVSLNTEFIFLDLHLAAGAALLYIAVLKQWNVWRYRHWCSLPTTNVGELGVWPLVREKSWDDVSLERLFQTLEKYAPGCRVVALDSGSNLANQARWTGISRLAALVGSQRELREAKTCLEAAWAPDVRACCEPQEIPLGTSMQEQVALISMKAWLASVKPVSDNLHHGSL
jgi:adenylate cyclase